MIAIQIAAIVLGTFVGCWVAGFGVYAVFASLVYGQAWSESWKDIKFVATGQVFRTR